MIPRKIEAKCELLLEAQKSDSTTVKAIAVYGGALHNDIKPETSWEATSFGPKMVELTNGRYIEIDLFVPEYIENDDDIKKEKWYSIFKKNCSANKVLVIKPEANQYIMILRKNFRY